MMKQIENIPNCRIYSDKSSTSFEEVYQNAKLEQSATIPQGVETIKLHLSIDAPLSLTEENLFEIRALYISSLNYGGYILYKGPYRKNIAVELPHRPNIWPEEINWGFDLLIPSKKAYCNWAAEEVETLEDANHPTSFKVELLARDIETHDGGFRSTVFTPIR